MLYIPVETIAVVSSFIKYLEYQICAICLIDAIIIALWFR